MSKTYLRSVWHLLSISVISVIFWAKREISFEVSTFRGLFFSGRGIATFGGLLLSGGRYFQNFTVFVQAKLSKMKELLSQRTSWNSSFFKPCLDMVSSMLWDDTSRQSLQYKGVKKLLNNARQYQQ